MGMRVLDLRRQIPIPSDRRRRDEALHQVFYEVREHGKGSNTMTPKLRYSFVPPISGGEQFWLINDMQEMFAVVSISVKYPNAEQVAKRLFGPLAGITFDE
jgi:hypothetical protein